MWRSLRSPNIRRWEGICSKKKPGTSLVTQWIRISLPMQGTWIRSLIWEDPTCTWETKPMSHSYWVPGSRAHEPQILKAACLEPVLCNKNHGMSSPCSEVSSNPHSLQPEKACMQQRRPRATKKKERKEKLGLWRQANLDSNARFSLYLLDNPDNTSCLWALVVSSIKWK